MKQKICFVLDQFLFGGTERVAVNYLKGIDKTKHDIDVVILSDVEEIINEIPKECNIIRLNIPRNHNPLSRASTMIRRPAGAILYYGTYALKKIFIYPFDYIKTSQLRRVKYDVAIAFSGHLNDCYVVLKFVKSKKKMVWAHEMLYKLLLYSPAWEKMFRNFDKIVSVSSAYQEDVLECKPYLNYSLKSIYNPTYKIVEKSNGEVNSKYGKYILSVGRLESPKDFETLIKAYFELPDSLKKEYKLLIIGDGSQRNKLNDLIKTLNLNNQVILLGTKRNVDIYYQDATLFVLSSKSEGLGLVLVEAMGNSCPVISTDSPYGPRDILKNNEYGLLCPVGDYKKMSEIIAEMLSNKDLREKYIKKGKERYKDFEIEKIMEEFYALINN